MVKRETLSTGFLGLVTFRLVAEEADGLIGCASVFWLAHEISLFANFYLYPFAILVAFLDIPLATFQADLMPMSGRNRWSTVSR
ncbi:hypothetical protein DWV00_15020 [Trinickia dinghuensis]|uniref:Uncharacterized protein n=1 Tax=Trinickia dinghuensis TaxID=2291023 RepID=A0A3D8JXK2_9BURK|nr:hypothetical protein DWV00_15020 [Trinickia dinghuensis]